MTKTALITGATGGLGHEFVKIHAQRGGNLVLVGRNPKKLTDLKAKVEQRYQVKAETIAVDFSDPTAAQTIFDQVQKMNVKIDILINNAGLGGQGEFIERTMDQDVSMMKVNMLVPTELMKLFLPLFVKRGSGKVLNVSSSVAMTPGPLQAEYYATKAYLTSLSNAIAYEVKDTGVTVTTLMPGAMDTGFAKAGGLTHTKMFAHGVSPVKVAQDGYAAMLKGKLNEFAGLPSYQRPLVSLMPMMPKKMMMGFVANQQSDKG
ncbi:oxidoreductase, short chain dehydrogenase reductase family protein [Lactobacillus selangorensis]|uniref:Oxidoreductase, short chain dehydrogenase reductase family protein n=1 Tax=Lactobacillus selangorensis TaxID=81857 RepID=A0A0R2FJ65_9LACO|nr:SDR family NAD(P)-dependent oxidoreductase [Lactobacillus selangorensis]KRN28705.1 oxidoreductase, short chain dehydrogenase reductase family protein [Lactobacillus selangorensis]KRN32885.1 oxidoreductase, short chain dehydrogenase reductase family protein [Lactobacillus selangorensis]